MTDLDERIRAELSAHLDAHRPLDAGAFSQALANRRRKRMTAKVVTASGVALLILLAGVAGFSLDFTDRSQPDPAKQPGSERHIVPVPGGVQDVTIDRESNQIWVLNQRGRIAHLDGEELRFADQALPRSGESLVAGPESTFWLTSARRLFRLDESGQVTGSAMFPNDEWQFDIGAGYGWRHAGATDLARVDLKTLNVETVPVLEDDDWSRVSDDIAAGLGAAWAADGTTGEVVRVDADTLETERFHIGRPEEPAGLERASAYVTSVAVGDDEVWACCDDKGDVVALDPVSGEVKTRIDLGDDEPDGDVAMDVGGGRLWVAAFGLYGEQSFEGLFEVDSDTYERAGPFPLPTGFADKIVATSEELLVVGSPLDDARIDLYRFRYSDLSSLPYPSEPEESRIVLWLILGGIIALLGLVVFLGRDANEDEEQ